MVPSAHVETRARKCGAQILLSGRLSEVSPVNSTMSRASRETRANRRMCSSGAILSAFPLARLHHHSSIGDSTERKPMKALITGYHESTNCTWCEKTTEGVTVEFDGGFLHKAALCFRCLQQAIRVHHKQQASTAGAPDKPRQTAGGAKS